MNDVQVAPATPAPPRRRRGLLFPLVLIALGGLFFAGNLGYIPPISWRAVIQLWPLLLVLSGIEMLLARRDAFLALGLEILVIALAVGLVVTQPRGVFLPQVGTASAATVARNNATSLSLRVEGGAGSYTVSGGASALVEARSDAGELRVREDRRGDAADVRVQPAWFGGGILGGVPPVNVDVRVASDVPTSLRVDGGAGDFTVDLRAIQVRDVRVATGASRLELTLPKPSGDVPIRIEAGAASIVIIVPADVEARITSSGGLLSTTSTNPRIAAGSSAALARSASSMETAGYAAAKDRVTVTVEAGASSITIN